MRWQLVLKKGIDLGVFGASLMWGAGANNHRILIAAAVGFIVGAVINWYKHRNWQ